MPTFFEFRQEISKLNKEKKYPEALRYFKDNKSQYSETEIAGNPYLVAAMLTALRHTNNFDNAFKFLDLYKITISEASEEILLSAYGWLLYSKFKAENLLHDKPDAEDDFFHDDEAIESGINVHFDKSQLLLKIEWFIPIILGYQTEFAYTLFSNLFNLVLKTEKKRPSTNWNFINEFCGLVTPAQLKTDCRTIEVQRKGVLKPMELASDRENWFAYKSKALMKLGKFEECYNLSNLALESFETFHYSNDVWFARRIALSKKNLGNSEEAIGELLAVLKRKKEWFIQKELSSLYLEAGDLDKAFKYAIDAINNFGDLEYKVDLLFLLGELHVKKGENDLAFRHYSLSQLIRKNEDWSIPGKLATALAGFNNPPIPIEKLKELLSELKKYWASFISQPKMPGKNNGQRMSGKIDKILHNDDKGADGFIKYDGNKSVYFRVNSTDEIIKKLKVGLPVDFKILPGTEDKKEKAISLRVL